MVNDSASVINIVQVKKYTFNGNFENKWTILKVLTGHYSSHDIQSYMIKTSAISSLPKPRCPVC